MHESSGRDGRSGWKRLLSTKLNARVLVTLALALAVVLAGCAGIGGLGSDGDSVAEADTPSGNEPDGDAGDDATTTTAASGSDDGDGADDDSDGADTGSGSDGGDADAGNGSGADNSGDGASAAGSVFGGDAEAEESWFNLSRPGHYAFDLAGMDQETGEQVTGRLIYDIEAAGEGEVTTSVDYEFGGEQFQSSTTGPAEEASAQLFLNQAYVPVSTLQSVSLLYLFEMGFTDPSVGNRKQSSTEEGTQVTEVIEKRTYGGLECFFVQTTLDGQPSREGCIRGSDGGIAPYAAIYTEDGELELKVELVEYEQE
ncbi:hypothetical protein [Halococcus agarilyticus]|uniref:hypothetical protein n=1 Tax=Halococcus agarilyticus TaxID=1232219 RepID=UPI0006778CF0|nr:hypothetical protein [Halococcus agarilyticus]